MRGQLTEKADVFSFGIVALELVSGRGNLDLRLPPDQAYLLDWVSGTCSMTKTSMSASFPALLVCWSPFKT